MKEVKGHCLCGKVEITLNEYGAFIYTCHCDMCRRQAAGPVMAVDPGTSENVVFSKGKEHITVYQSSENVQRGFCALCGTYIFWHDHTSDHYCMNAELFDEVITNGEFGLQLFYDKKPDYYEFINETKKMNSRWEEV